MASFSDKITLTIDVITGRSANSPFKGLRDDIDQTDGAFNKLKVGAGGVFDAIGQNAAGLALGAGAAIAGFAAKGVLDFQSLALSTGELRDKFSLTSEEASRWQEVLADTGISVGSFETSMGKMLKTAGGSPDVFRNLGVDIAYAKDGSVDANGTFLNVIERLNGMKDPAERAAAAQQLLGKSWQESAELIGLGADGVKQRLDEVSGAKIITDDQIGEARDMRDSLDDLSDAVDNVSLSLGSTLAPIITTGADLLMQLAAAADFVKGALERVSDIPVLGHFASQMANPLAMVQLAKEKLDELWVTLGLFGEGGTEIEASLSPELIADLEAANAATAEQAKLASDGTAAMAPFIAAMKQWGSEGRIAAQSMDDVATSFDDTSSAADRAKESADGLADSLDDVFGSATDVQGAQDQMSENFDELNATILKGTGNIDGFSLSLDQSTESGRANREQVRNNVQGVQEYIQKLAESGATSEQVNGEYSLLRQQLVNQLTQFGLTEDGANQYINTLGLTPDNVTTAVNLQNQEQAKADVEAHLAKLGEIPHDWATAIKASIDQGNYLLAEEQLNQLARTRFATIRATTSSTGGARNTGGGPLASAAGRFVPGGSNVLSTLGENSGRRGDEVVLPLGDPGRTAALLSDSRVAPRLPVVASGGGSTYQITINAPTGKADAIAQVLADEMWRQRVQNQRVAATR